MTFCTLGTLKRSAESEFLHYKDADIIFQNVLTLVNVLKMFRGTKCEA